MRRRSRWVLLSIAALCVLTVSGRLVTASTMQFFTLEAMCEMSDTIVQGEVVDAVAAYEPNGQIWTTYTIAVSETLKSRSPRIESEIIVKPIGGTVGDLTLQASLIPHFVTGEEVLLFTKNYGAAWQSVANGPQGCLRVDRVSTTDARGRRVERELARVLPQLYESYAEGDLAVFKQDVRAILEAQAQAAQP